MSRYFIELSYDGTNYHGWQVQPNGVSVQETLQQALSTLLRQDIEIVGAGRTDAGVHASMMVAHFDFSGSVELDAIQLVYKLNKLLPHDIAVRRVYQVPDDMHTRKSPFLRHYSWLVTFPLDFDKMNEAAKRLLEFEDFTSFSKVNTDTKTNICHVTEAQWKEITPPLEGQGGGAWRFTITANRFLRNMVRAIVGTLIEVGRGRMTVDEFCQVIEQKNRCSAGESVPGHALFLTEVKYS